MSSKQTLYGLYWFAAGGLIGFGLISFDLILPAVLCILLGFVLLIVGLRRWGRRLLWVAVLGLGLVPALVLLNTILKAPPPCSSTGALSLPADASAGTTVSCGSMPGGYYVMLEPFAGLVLVALCWPFVRRAIHR